jgi:bifunctional DNase/RNase
MLLASAAATAARPVEVEVDGLGIDAMSGSPVVRLVEKGAGTRRELPIWIGPAEAQAIAIELGGVPPPRPLTHDLMKRLVERLGGRLQQVVIEELRNGTYYATHHLDGPAGKSDTVDARPSDGIALALRLRSRIVVAEELFGEAWAAPLPTAARLWGLGLQDLTPEVATFFGSAGGEGVLVTDVTIAGPAAELARGDVITALDDAPVHSVRELQARAESRPDARPVELSVRRGGDRLIVKFKAP